MCYHVPVGTEKMKNILDTDLQIIYFFSIFSRKQPETMMILMNSINIVIITAIGIMLFLLRDLLGTGEPRGLIMR